MKNPNEMYTSFSHRIIRRCFACLAFLLLILIGSVLAPFVIRNISDSYLEYEKLQDTVAGIKSRQGDRLVAIHQQQALNQQDVEVLTKKVEALEEGSNGGRAAYSGFSSSYDGYSPMRRAEIEDAEFISIENFFLSLETIPVFVESDASSNDIRIFECALLSDALENNKKWYAIDDEYVINPEPISDYYDGQLHDTSLPEVEPIPQKENSLSNPEEAPKKSESGVVNIVWSV